jgi:hypothetical protein
MSGGNVNERRTRVPRNLSFGACDFHNGNHFKYPFKMVPNHSREGFGGDMKAQRKGGVATRKKLLAAAGRVFAEKGYHDATIAEICRLAGTNIAAVNYHFSDKETLYLEALRFNEEDRGVAG